MITLVLLAGSNVFMTYAWYGHLRDLKGRPLWIAILASWGVALLEYCLQVPANRIGFAAMSLAQLKVAQEIITMVVFAVFATWYMKERLTMDFLYASVCLAAAAFFMFRGVGTPA
ncbi:MAG: DMT family protein [Planctomycetota bacterium]